MAEAKPDPTKPSPALAAVPDPQAPRAQGAPEEPARRGAPWWLFALAVLLLGVSVWGLWSQTQHARAQARELALLNEQVVELETEVATLDGQLSAFGMQRDLVSVSVSDLVARLADLKALVDWNPLEPGGPPPAPSPASPPGASAGEAPAEPGPPAEPGSAAEEPSASAGGAAAGSGSALDLDSVPGLRPGPSLELAPPAGGERRINGV